LNHFESEWERYQIRVEQVLRQRVASIERIPPRLSQGMKYACLNGGKRFRAFLVYACGKLAGASLEQLDAPACAVEMIHAYSLTHDDLPAMDDDKLRRGKPSCHIAFDEATAILVGDALQAEAFAILADGADEINGVSQARMIAELAKASGGGGMVGGQILDMEATGKTVDYGYMVRMHGLKTGALIRASALLGGLAAEKVGQNFLARLDRYAAAVGLAFQISDDILDETSDSGTLGKPAGADSRMKKSTYTSVLGPEKARAEAKKLCDQAIETVQGLGDNARLLEQLAKFVVKKKSVIPCFSVLTTPVNSKNSLTMSWLNWLVSFDNTSLR